MKKFLILLFLLVSKIVLAQNIKAGEFVHKEESFYEKITLKTDQSFIYSQFVTKKINSKNETIASSDNKNVAIGNGKYSIQNGILILHFTEYDSLGNQNTYDWRKYTLSIKISELTEIK